jgi:hypothetical protein
VVWDNTLRANGGGWTGPTVADGSGHVIQIAVTSRPDGTMHLETLT